MEDPRGHGQWTEHQGYLQMNVDSGVDLWHGANYDAPRLIQPIQGNFTIETRIPSLRSCGSMAGCWSGKVRGRFCGLKKPPARILTGATSGLSGTSAADSALSAGAPGCSGQSIST